MTLFIGLLLVANTFGSFSPQIQLQTQEHGSPRRSIPETDDDEEPEAQFLTPEQEEKLRLAREAGNAFLKRWHETLDLELLWDEWFVSDPVRMQRAMSFFFGDDKQHEEEAKQQAHAYEHQEGDDQEAAAYEYDPGLAREVLVSMFNCIYLSREYSLTLETLEAEEGRIANAEVDPEIKKAEENLFDHTNESHLKNRATAEEMREFLARVNHLSSLYRKYLPPVTFSTRTYQENLKRLNGHGADAMIIYDFRESPGAADIPVYAMRLGVLRFLLIEEYCQFKVLALTVDRC
jgi:hypothetical protein